MESTCCSGLTFKTEKNITKNDIITMCNLLNSRDEYSSQLCTFEPEPITEGGIVFKFKNNNEWYKSVRFCNSGVIMFGKDYHQWDWVNANVMTEWLENNDIIFDKNYKFDTIIKSFHGAPIFTLDELKIWEEYFNQIGVKKVGKYPSKKKLSCYM